jgi:hypothetical protein
VKPESPADALPVPEPAFPFFTRRGLTYWSLQIAGFGAVQVVVQLLLAVAGLIIVRSLPKSEYALFAIANSMQVACTQLADLGVGIGMRSIGGRVYNDRARLGQLVTTALGLRRQFLLIAIAMCLPLMVWLLYRNGASVTQVVELSFIVVAAVIPLLGVSVWTVTLLLHGDYQKIQRLDLGNALLRLLLVLGLALSRINAALTVLVGAIVNSTQALFLGRWAKRRAEVTAPPNLEDRKELVRLSIKSLPNTIFFCFQGQVTLLIFTWIGNSTGIADITALGRLALLFTVFSVMFGNLLGPRFARCQDPSRLRRLYLFLVGGTAAVLLPLWAVAAFFPAPFLWLLGAKYSGLQRECGWVVASGCLSQLAGVMWNMSSSRAWISVQAFAFIPVILVAQLITALSLDLRNFHNVVLFNFVTAAAPIPLYAIDAYIGLRRSLTKERTNLP